MDGLELDDNVPEAELLWLALLLPLDDDVQLELANEDVESFGDGAMERSGVGGDRYGDKGVATEVVLEPVGLSFAMPGNVEVCPVAEPLVDDDVEAVELGDMDADTLDGDVCDWAEGEDVGVTIGCTETRLDIVSAAAFKVADADSLRCALADMLPLDEEVGDDDCDDDGDDEGVSDPLVDGDAIVLCDCDQKPLTIAGGELCAEPRTVCAALYKVLDAHARAQAEADDEPEALELSVVLLSAAIEGPADSSGKIEALDDTLCDDEGDAVRDNVFLIDVLEADISGAFVAEAPPPDPKSCSALDDTDGVVVLVEVADAVAELELDSDCGRSPN